MELGDQFDRNQLELPHVRQMAAIFDKVENRTGLHISIDIDAFHTYSSGKIFVSAPGVSDEPEPFHLGNTVMESGSQRIVLDTPRLRYDHEALVKSLSAQMTRREKLILVVQLLLGVLIGLAVAHLRHKP